MNGEKINLLVIAFKNLGRHRVKTILTSIAITIGMALYIWMDSWLMGMNLDSRRNLINYETGSAKIYSKAYFEKKDELPMYETFKDYGEIINKLDKAGYNTSEHAVFAGSLLSAETELPFVFMGIEPEKEKKLFKYFKYTEPPHKISKYVFENKILQKTDNISYKKTLLDSYELNFSEDTYYYKKPDIENDPKIQKVNKEIKKINYLLEEQKSNGKKKLYDKKLDELNRKYRSIARILERDYNDKITRVFKSIDYYNFIESGKFDALIGVKGAKDLKVKTGDNIKCSVIIDKKDEKGRVRHVHQLIDLKVAGIINSPNPKTNGYIAYIPLDILQDDKGIMLNGEIMEICIRKKNAKDHMLPGKDESAEYIKKILGNTLSDNLTLVGWQEDAKDYLAMSAQDLVSTYIMVGLLFVLAVMGIANTMLMAIFERTKEIGMLRANGMRDFDIIKLFLYEAGLIGLIGSVIGLIIGILLNIWIIYWGIDYTDIYAETNMQNYGYRVVGIFKGAWNYHTIIASPFIATLIAAFTAFIPAMKAVKMAIVDALKFE